MAHLENGYLQLANKIAEALARNHIRLTVREYQMIMHVFRKSYGYGKKWARISMRDYSKATGIDFRECQKVEKRLRDRNIIIREGPRVKFQKYSSKWKNVGRRTDRTSRLEQLRSQKQNEINENVGRQPDERPFVGRHTDESVGRHTDTLNKKEILINKPSTEFIREWESVLDMVQRFGRYEFPKFDNPILETVVRRIGWSTFCNMTSFQWKEIRDRFLRCYIEEVEKAEGKK